MDQTAVTAAARRLMGEYYARKVDDDDITTATTDAARILGEILMRASPEYFITRKSLQSYTTNGCQFAIPTDANGDVVSILRVWDMDGNAKSVTGAEDNGDGLVQITSAAHGFSDDDVVRIHDVAGCTEANGVWIVDNADTDTFDLYGSTFAEDYTSGGKIFKESDNDFTLIRRQTADEISNENETRYFLQGAYIFIDDSDFDNDIIVSYVSHPLTLASIPVRFHFGLPGYAAMTLIDLPGRDDPMFTSLQHKLKVADGLWKTCMDLAKGFRPIVESENISESKVVRRWI